MNQTNSLATHSIALMLLMVLALPVTADTPASRFITLGTNSGPIPNANRAHPANFLSFEDTALLIDAGDGVTGQLAKTGIPMGAIDAVLLSHLHFDHTGGLFALLGQRYQTSNFSPLVIYGPPGTKRTVDGLLDAMAPMAEAGDQLAAVANQPPEANIKVVELVGGERFEIGSIQLSTVVNTHYIISDPKGTKSQSLSYRFDLPDRSITYSGDTGPSEALEKLAMGSDVLVLEIMMPHKSLAAIRANRPDVPEAAWGPILNHFQRQHLSPAQAGQLAERAHAKMLVLTHNAIAPEHSDEARQIIEDAYAGPTRFAEDLQAF